MGDSYAGDHFDWPDYRPVLESDAEVEHIRKGYAALLTMCDDSLGRLLDRMDEYDMWDDTALIVCTDHGFLLGEHEWYGKNAQPWYEETIHTPLFVWDPKGETNGAVCDAFVQTIDVAATLLDLFGLERPKDMQGRSILSLTRRGATTLRGAGLFGIFGGHVSVTDGRHVYMRSSATPANTPLVEYTLMPTRMKSRYGVAELADIELVPAFDFTKGLRLLRTRGMAFGNPYHFGSLIYDLEADPEQNHPIDDAALELTLATLLVQLMRENDAPESQFERLGLPATGEVDESHLLVNSQWAQVEASQNRNWRKAPASDFAVAGTLTIAEAHARPALGDRVGQAFGMPLGKPVVDRFGPLTLWHLAVMSPAMTPERLKRLDADLAQYKDALS